MKMQAKTEQKKAEKAEKEAEEEGVGGLEGGISCSSKGCCCCMLVCSRGSIFVALQHGLCGLVAWGRTDGRRNGGTNPTVYCSHYCFHTVQS